MTTTRERLEHDQDVKIRAGWRCQARCQRCVPDSDAP
jgi:hypothetical protein